MFSKSIEKYVNSLKQKKYRIEHSRFIAEGEKIAAEVLSSALEIDKVIALPGWIIANELLLKEKNAALIEVNEQQMSRISSLIQPSSVLLIIETPTYAIDENEISSNIHLALESISDPGNMGTIIRIADWFGIPSVFCSEDCVEVYNPKVVQATMGSFARVKCFEMNLGELFKRFPAMTVYGATLEGSNIYKTQLDDYGFIVIGNESSGISESLMPYINKKVTIPKFGQAQSLNAAVAAGIVCASFFCRRELDSD